MGDVRDKEDVDAGREERVGRGEREGRQGREGRGTWGTWWSETFCG